MAKIFITGSSDGLGRMAAQWLTEQKHDVVLHARSEARAEDARQSVPGAQDVIVGDVSTIAGMRAVAESANRLGRFDAVIHNAAVGYQEPLLIATADDLPHVFAINTLAPYVLTALMERPDRLGYLSSGLHKGGDVSLDDLAWRDRSWRGTQAYSDSKLHDTMLAFALARLWPDVLSNAVEPGWVATKMGGAGATDDLDQGHRTQAWLAVSDDPAAKVSGEYFYHLARRKPLPAAHDEALQEKLLERCRAFSGIDMPRS